MAKRGGEVERAKLRRNHVISYRSIREFLAAHPGDDAAHEALGTWYRTTAKATWTKFADVRATFPHADQVGPVIVFNVGGNKYRVICRIHFTSSVVYILHVLTHAEYDKGKWKFQP
jgi:mRNA interferase HigB